jgi:phosphoserine phosphatase RsbU/P
MNLILLALVVGTTFAQDIEVKGLGEASPLAGVWKEKLGDDPRWADPAFDDSSWTSVEMPKPARPGAKGYTWHRIHVVLQGSLPQKPLFVVIGPLYPAYEIFANGQKIGSFGGELGTAIGQRLAEPAKFQLPRSTNMVLAIRSYDSLEYIGKQASSTQISASWVALEHTAGLLISKFHEDRHERSLAAVLLCVTLALGGLLFLAVFSLRTSSREYLWGGLLVLSLMWNRTSQFLPHFINDNRLILHLSSSASDLLVPVSWVFFSCSIFQLRSSWFARFFIGFYWLIVFLEYSDINTIGFRTLLIFLMGATYLETALAANKIGISRSSAWPVHLAMGSFAFLNTLFFLLLWLGGRQYGESAFTYVDVLLRSPILLLMFALGIILAQRSSRQDKEQARLQQEFAAAAQVQSLLVPAQSIAGVEGVYLPAAEVGGDFYYATLLPDQSRLIAVGDVSGKGLKAAMLVSVVMGALRQSRESSPSQILTDLNRVLLGQTGGGFVTAICARFDADAKVTLANAGHPSPYCDGKETDIEAGLPLGILDGANYQESSVNGTYFTFVSDGVVEAENAQRELFGFDRTREISTSSAQEIASAAKDWGQNDDITVVTVRRTA